MKFKVIERVVPVIKKSLPSPKPKETAGIKKGDIATGDQKIDNKVLQPRQVRQGLSIGSNATSQTSRTSLTPNQTVKKLTWEFSIAPESIEWSRQASLSTSETFMTNEQPVIYGYAGMAEVTFSGLLFDGIHYGNDVTIELGNVEQLLQVDEENFSPRVYDMFAESRLYGTFVIKSIKITELRRTLEGKTNRFVADIVWQKVPSYQIRTSNDLAMPAEILPEITVETATANSDGGSVSTRAGCIVEKGTVVAYVGNTGRSKGAHVHFEKRVGQNKVDPSADADYFYINGRPMSQFKGTLETHLFRNAERPRHQGVDYPANEGLPISVNQSTKLLKAAWENGWGNYFECEVNGNVYLIAHCSKINKNLFACDQASRSSKNSGNTGGNVVAKTNTTNNPAVINKTDYDGEYIPRRTSR